MPGFLQDALTHGAPIVQQHEGFIMRVPCLPQTGTASHDFMGCGNHTVPQSVAAGFGILFTKNGGELRKNFVGMLLHTIHDLH